MTSRRRVAGEEQAVLWAPERLADQVDAVEDLRALRYVVLEEMVDGVASLLAWSWPLVDAKGRLFWPPDAADAPIELSVPMPLLLKQVYQAGHLHRDPRCGDTFAGALAEHGPPDATVQDLRRVFPDGLYDLSAEAHQAAKLSYQGALAGIRGARQEEDEAVLLDKGTLRHVRLGAPERRHAGDAS